jgi:hypothetical protein
MNVKITQGLRKSQAKSLQSYATQELNKPKYLTVNQTKIYAHDWHDIMLVVEFCFIILVLLFF